MLTIHHNNEFNAVNSAIDLIVNTLSAIGKSLLAAIIIYPLMVALLIAIKIYFIYTSLLAKRRFKSSSFEETKKAYHTTYQVLENRVRVVNTLKVIAPFPIAALFNSIYNSCDKINKIAKQNLFVPTECLDEKELNEHRETMKSLDDIWAEDENDEYAKITHKILHQTHETA